MMDKSDKKPLLISHRGAHKEAPENSCKAFELALQYGVDGIETDVQLSSDGVPVLFHNPTASHITGSRKPSILGKRVPVSEFPLWQKC